MAQSDWDAKLKALNSVPNDSGINTQAIAELRRLYTQNKSGTADEVSAARIDELEKQLGLHNTTPITPAPAPAPAPTARPKPTETIEHPIINAVGDEIGRQGKRVVGAMADSMIGTIQNPAGQQAVTSPFMQAQADQLREAATRQQASAQQSAQIANRSDVAEADRIAAGQAASRFQQGVAQTGGQAGAAAAALANANIITPDVSAVQQRQDLQRAEAYRRQTAADSTAVDATGYDMRAANQNELLRQRNMIAQRARDLALADDGNNDQPVVPPEEDATVPSPQNNQPKSEEDVRLGARVDRAMAGFEKLSDPQIPQYRQQLFNALKMLASSSEGSSDEQEAGRQWDVAAAALNDIIRKSGRSDIVRITDIWGRKHDGPGGALGARRYDRYGNEIPSDIRLKTVGKRYGNILNNVDRRFIS